MNKEPTINGGNQTPTTVQKPWGRDSVFAGSSEVFIKEITLLPMQSISRQFHRYKDEIYLVRDGSGTLEIGFEDRHDIELQVGYVVHVPPGSVHRLRSGPDGIVIIEISTPEIADIQRIEDANGRPTIPYDVIDKLLPDEEPAATRPLSVAISVGSGTVRCLGVSDRLVLSQMEFTGHGKQLLAASGNDVVCVLSGDCILRTDGIAYRMRIDDCMMLERGQRFSVIAGEFGVTLLHGSPRLQETATLPMELAKLSSVANAAA